MYHALDRLQFWGLWAIVDNTGADLTDRTGRLVASKHMPMFAVAGENQVRRHQLIDPIYNNAF